MSISVEEKNETKKMTNENDRAFRAMTFARNVHATQVRKYSGNPYADHLAEVAGIVATVTSDQDAIAVAWLHDCMEDQGVELSTLIEMFGPRIADGVKWLSDLETGNRAERKRLSCERLATAPDWVQTIKCADLISNTSSIVKHDPDFAIVYLKEKALLLEVLTMADKRLMAIALAQSKTNHAS